MAEGILSTAFRNINVRQGVYGAIGCGVAITLYSTCPQFQTQTRLIKSLVGTIGTYASLYLTSY